ncbi:uncharacterized protein ISCGN_005147 [Ixodes scapularis]
MHDITRETMQTLSFVQVLLTAALAATSPTSPGNLLHDPLTRDDSRIAAKHVATGPPMLSPTTRPDPDAYIFDAWQHSSSGTSRDPCLRRRLQKPTTRDGQLGHDIARETMQTLSFVQDARQKVQVSVCMAGAQRISSLGEAGDKRLLSSEVRSMSEVGRHCNNGGVGVEEPSEKCQAPIQSCGRRGLLFRHEFFASGKRHKNDFSAGKHGNILSSCDP